MKHKVIVKPSRGNPQSLTVRQHIFPAQSIKRFANTDGYVWVNDITHFKARMAKPTDEVFVAKRAWDQRAEAGYMKYEEDMYQSLAEYILSGGKFGFESDHYIITRMYALWVTRHHRAGNPFDDTQLNLVSGSQLSQEHQEVIESKHGLFIDANGRIPARMMNGTVIQTHYGQLAASIGRAGYRWGLLTSRTGEFIVPDSFVNVGIMPLTPTQCLAAGSDNAFIDNKSVKTINRQAIESSANYFFARDIRKCPL